MKLLKSVVLIIILACPTAQADEYNCYAKVNPQRGFNFDFIIRIDSTTVDGQMIIKAGFTELILAVVTETGSFKRDEKTQQDAFDKTLAMLDEEDVCSVSDTTLVETIKYLRAVAPTGEEAMVYRLYDKNSQIGGTFMMGGAATSCVP